MLEGASDGAEEGAGAAAGPVGPAGVWEDMGGAGGTGSKKLFRPLSFSNWKIYVNCYIFGFMTERTLRPPRHRADAAYARGEETRKRIIDVALRLFGERGFEGASTREIAKAAGVNAPALQYYFDNKEGVYRACAEYIADSSAAHFGPLVEQTKLVLDDPAATQDALFEAFGVLLDGLADFQLVPDDAEYRRLFIAHEQVGHAPGVLFELFDQSLRPKMGEMSVGLIARYCGMPVTDPLLPMRVMMLCGQVMVFSLGKRTLLTKLRWDAFGPDEIALIKQAARTQSRVLMDSWRAEASAARDKPAAKRTRNAG